MHGLDELDHCDTTVGLTGGATAGRPDIPALRERMEG
jgi:hypothetical protein